MELEEKIMRTITSTLIVFATATDSEEVGTFYIDNSQLLISVSIQ